MPGFEVVPVGVAETAMIESKIDLNDVDEVLKLAKILRVDAIVVGAVTEYSPYYPPRIGMQVNWYSPKAWQFYPGIQIEPAQRCQLNEWDRQRRQEWRDYQKRLDEETAPETPAWQRMYRCFKRWPFIRTIYGEPTLCRNGEQNTLVWRAQSPTTQPPAGLPGAAPRPAGVQPSSQSAVAPALPDLEAIPPDAVVREAATSAPSASQTAALVKIPHYQESPAPTAIAGAALTREDELVHQPPPPPVPLPSDGAGAVNPPPVPSPATATPRQAAPAPAERLVEPAPLPKVVPAPPVPESRGQDRPSPSLSPTPFDGLPMNPDLPGTMPSPAKPVLPHPGASEPLEKESPKMQPVRDPHLAPPAPQPNPYNVPQPIQPWQTDPRMPLMSYTRLFDGSDAELVAALRDYVELNGDLRSGGWEAYLHRSDDFIRFTSFRMILEMLSLHGGEGKHRMIFKFRKYK